jgi:hypothetical protein
MNNLDVAYISGTMISWGHLKWIVELPDSGLGGRFFGFHSLSHGNPKRERPPQYGQNHAQAPMGFPQGEYTPPMPKIGWHAHGSDANSFAPFTSFLALLMTQDRSYGNVRMNWKLYVDHPTMGALYEWFDVYLVGESGDWERGPEGLKREQEFTCLRHFTNGGSLFDQGLE